MNIVGVLGTEVCTKDFIGQKTILEVDFFHTLTMRKYLLTWVLKPSLDPFS